MRLLSAPRHPFVGLAAAATMGIMLAEFLPLSAFALTAIAIFVAACAVALFFLPRLVATYLVVLSTFFCYTIFRQAILKDNESPRSLATGRACSRSPEA